MPTWENEARAARRAAHQSPHKVFQVKISRLKREEDRQWARDVKALLEAYTSPMGALERAYFRYWFSEAIGTGKLNRRLRGKRCMLNICISLKLHVSRYIKSLSFFLDDT